MFASHRVIGLALVVSSLAVLGRAAVAGEGPAQYVIHVSVDGLAPAYLEALLDEGAVPGFKRLQTEGVWTHNARTDFDYLRRTEGDVHVVEGDGRLQLREARRGTYGLVVLDAFSSDAIPAHLLTEEAVGEYRRVLRPHGLLAFHVTNRHLDLVPVLAAEAQRLGMTAVVRRDLSAAPPASVSTWVVLARAPADLDRLRTRPGWVAAEPRSDVRAWTDDYSSLVEVLDVGWD